MNPELKERWLAALESGEYKRGAGRLCTVTPYGEKRHCCLGVLLEITEGLPPGMYGSAFGRASAYLPERLVDGFGMTSRLAGMNDDGTTSDDFNCVIPFIRENL